MKREEWNRKYAAPEFVWGVEPNQFLVAEVESLVPGRALDLACGEGRNAVWLAQQGWRVTGVDFSKVALAKAERLARSRSVEVEWVAADVLDYRPSGGFELVAILYLQLPTDERRLVLGQAADALGPGGVLLVVGHDLSNLTEGCGGPTDAAVLFTPADVTRELPGLFIERAERVRRRVTVDEGEAEAIDALVRATKPRSASTDAPAPRTGRHR